MRGGFLRRISSARQDGEAGKTFPVESELLNSGLFSALPRPGIWSLGSVFLCEVQKGTAIDRSGMCGCGSPSSPLTCLSLPCASTQG